MKEYLDLVRLVLEQGVRKKSRTGVDTLSYFSAFYRVDLSQGFPLLTTKKVNFNAVLHELLWYLSGEDHIRNLRKVTKIWDAWADEAGDLETAYGRYWRRFPHPVQKSHAPISETGETAAPVLEIDQIQYVIDEIKRNPASRRLVVTAWEPGNAEASKLPPCHYSFAFNVTPAEGLGVRGKGLDQKAKLNCHLTQRSGDIALGIPFNLACYATLTQMIAQECGLDVGLFAHTIIDAHIYAAEPGSAMAAYDHVAGLKEQLQREPRPLPKLTIARKPFDELKFEDFKLEGYDPHPAISFKVAVQFGVQASVCHFMQISAIVAMTHSGLMGVAGKLPWHVPEDLRHFKDTTRGHAVLMGRKTFESIGKRPLPKRRNLVITRQADYEAPGAEVFTTVEAAVEAVRNDGAETELFVVGGSEIYAAAMALTDKLIVTWMTITPEPTGDTYFPAVDWALWHDTERRELAVGAEVVVYERKAAEA